MQMLTEHPSARESAGDYRGEFAEIKVPEREERLGHIMPIMRIICKLAKFAELITREAYNPVMLPSSPDFILDT